MNRRRAFTLLMLLGGILFLLTGCESDGTNYVTTSQYSVYRGYNYRPGYGYYYPPPYYYDDDDRPHRPDRPGKPPGKPPGRPPHGPVTIQPVPKPRPPANIGRPRPRPMPRPRPARRRAR
ncbi:MAG: hypothetical protein GXO34_08555 [Deltaproteobacteria bacterium]|nr:hypothetical protein [Deltaproteobacteria bacterium]